MCLTGTLVTTLLISVHLVFHFHITCQTLVILLLPHGQSLQSSWMSARCGGAGFMPGIIEDLWAPRLQFGCRSQTPKAFFANFYSTWLWKKFVANNPFCHLVSELDSSRMPQVELVLLGEVHRHFWTVGYCVLIKNHQIFMELSGNMFLGLIMRVVSLKNESYVVLYPHKLIQNLVILSIESKLVLVQYSSWK